MKQTKHSTKSPSPPPPPETKKPIDWSWLADSKDCTNEPFSFEGLILDHGENTPPLPEATRAELDRVMEIWAREWGGGSQQQQQTRNPEP